MTRLLTLVALGLALTFAPTLGEAASKHIHVTAKVQQTFIGDPASPKLGDRIISDAELFDDSGAKVGAGGAVCTIVSIQESSTDPLIQCLLSAVFDKGQIIFGGLAPFPEAGAVGHFGILGGTDAFRKARGDATLVVLANGDVDTILDLE
jgi:hypothetical protein